MKKVVLGGAVAVVSVLPFVFSNNAFAASCPVGFTGPNSTNICRSVTTYGCTVENTTTVDVTSQNTQIAVSGDATSPNGSTGSATNSNGTTFTATVKNGTCTAVATVPATPTPTSTTSTTAAVTPPKPATAAALPDTSSNNMPLILGGAVALLGVGAVVTRFVVAVYSRVKS